MPTTDKNGREIMVGDVLRVYHFTGKRRKKYFMFKQVVGVVPGKTCDFFKISHLDLKDGGYLMLQDGEKHEGIEIVQGFGTDGVSFDKRLRT